MLGLDGLGKTAPLSSLEPPSNVKTTMESAASSTFLHNPPRPITPDISNGMGSSHLHMSAIPIDASLDDTSLAEFLRDVMSPHSMLPADAMGDLIPQSYPPRDIFNFGIDANLDFNDLDFGWIDSQNSVPAWNSNWSSENDPAVDRSQQAPDDVRSSINAGAEAFERSLWRWAPQKQEHAYAEQVNLSLPYKDLQSLEARLGPEILAHRLEQNSRDRILAMLLSTCEPVNVPRVVTSFPSAEVLESLMHLFFRSESTKTDSWIHLPTFRPQSQRPEMNGIVVAAGALLSTVPTVRKLGFAIQEAVRLAIPQIVGFTLLSRSELLSS